MPTPQSLRCADLQCHFKPELGGSIAGLWLGGVPVLRSTPAPDLHSVRQAASDPLVPFSNRVSRVNDAVNRMAQTGQSANALGVRVLQAGENFFLRDAH